MTDQLELICKEIREERAAICEFDGLLTREQAEQMGLLESEAYRMACEVRTALEWPLQQRRDYLERVEKVRGVRAAGVLRDAIRTEWLRRKAA